MTDITISIPTEHTQRILDGICGRFGYKDTINENTGTEEEPVYEDIPNPETKAQFAKGHIIRQMKEWVAHYEKTTQISLIESQIVDDIDTNILIE